MKYILTLALTVAFATSTFAGKCGSCSGDECGDKGKDKDKDKAEQSTQG